MEIAIKIFAGLGLFFIGVRLIADHLKQMTGQRLRAMVARAVSNNRSAALFGLAAGAVLRSVNAVIFLLSTLVSAGAIDTKRAIPVINWANLGTSMIVLLASFNLHLMVLVLLGITGLAYYRNFDQSARFRHLVGAMLGIGLLFLGLEFIQEGAAKLKYAPWLQEIVSSSGKSFVLSFVLGAAVTLLAQSSSTITVVAMTVASAGLLDISHGVTVVLGAGLASGVSAWLLGRNLAGSARQLVMYQLILKTAGVSALLLLLLFEYVSGLPLLLALFDKLALPPATTLAVVYVLLQIICDLAVHPFHHRLTHFLEHYSPESDEEVLGKPRFLNDRALAEPVSALELVECEQRRLLADLPTFVDALRDDVEQSTYSAEVLRAAGAKVVTECGHFLTALADRNQSREVLERSIVLRDRNDLINSLQETLVELNHAVVSVGDAPEVSNLIHSLVEGLHMMLTLLAETEAQPNPDDLELLRSLTHDRSDLMDNIRHRLLGMGESLTPGLQRSVFSATSLFERSVWLMRRYVLLLDVTRFQADAAGLADEADALPVPN